MKKFILKLAIIAGLLFCLFSCSKTPAPTPYQEPARTKKLTVRIFQLEDYAATIYDSTYAEVEIGAYKQLLADGSRTYLWDTLLPRQRLRLFPATAQPLVLVKAIPHIYDSKERVRIYTIIKYDNQGTYQTGGGVIPFATGADSLLVNLPL